MYKIIELHSIKLKNNLKCKVCPSPFEFIDYMNSESVVADVNELSITSKNIMLDPLIVFLLKQKRKKNFREKWIEL